MRQYPFCRAALFVVCLSAAPLLAQETSPSVADKATEAPLPEPAQLVALMKAHSDTWRETEKNYMCKLTTVKDDFDSHGNKKGTHTDEYRVFFVERREIHQHISHDGKPLSPDEEKKEQQRVDKLIADIKAKAEKQEAKPTPPPRLAMLLKVTTLSNERRETINGRPTIIFDYTGNPKAKADNEIEEVMKLLTGHIWIDEQDAATERLDGELQQNFHIGGGLIANVKKGGHFAIDYTRVNGEIWFTHTVEGHVDGHILLFKGFDANGRFTFSDYRKMKTSVTLQPGVRLIDANGQPIPDVLETPPASPQGP